MSHDYGPFPVLPGDHVCEGPKLSFHIPRPTAPVLYSHLGTRIQISPQESESSVSLCTNIGNMSIPFQIICVSYTQVFYAFNVFQYSALKGIVSLYLTRPFICQLHHVAFNGLKSHSPFPSPTA